MAFIQPSSNRLWQKWVGYMTGGAHGIQQAAIVREDGCVLAASHGLAISKREILVCIFVVIEIAFATRLHRELKYQKPRPRS